MFYKHNVSLRRCICGVVVILQLATGGQQKPANDWLENETTQTSNKTNCDIPPRQAAPNEALFSYITPQTKRPKLSEAQ